jgi:hypothetical protein
MEWLLADSCTPRFVIWLLIAGAGFNWIWALSAERQVKRLTRELASAAPAPGQSPAPRASR